MDPNYLQNIKVLVVDDDEDDWFITRKIFSRITDSPFSIEWASTYDEAIEKIESDRHDAYLIDYRLGEHTGTDLLERFHPETRLQPFILMTGILDSDVERQSFKMAAADYLVKGSFDATLLSRTILYAMQRKYIEQQKIEQLIQLNQAKEEFISIASHQLRTPATGVKQYLGMVIEGFAGDVPPRQLKLLMSAYESNERQLRIISDLLKVAQVDSGKLKLRSMPIEINDFVGDVVEEQRHVASSRGQNIVYSPLQHPCALEIDPDIFRMVFENIIENASKYSHEGSTVRVQITEIKDEICVGIIDQGVGIEPDELHRLYEKFARINNPLSTKVGGSGLGLYWAKRIVDMQGGRIEYRPNKPNGSKFMICLPKHTDKNVK